jgi:hypothetical protein
MLADACKHNISQCAHYAASSWSPGGVVLLGAIVLIIIGWIKKK